MHNYATPTNIIIPKSLQSLPQGLNYSTIYGSTGRVEENTGVEVFCKNSSVTNIPKYALAHILYVVCIWSNFGMFT